MNNYLFTSERLGFRTYTQNDFDNIYALCSDTEVMHFFPAPLNQEESQAQLDKLINRQEQDGCTFWATELLETGEFIGFIGVAVIRMGASFDGGIEIGWRLKKEHWRNGYASEGAMACLEYARDVLGIKKVLSFTAKVNIPSQKVMEKIGMAKIDEFDHPALKDHPLEKHVLYQIEL